MARLNRLCPAGIAQHIIQRGNNRQVCFNGDEDMAAYAHWLKEFSDKYHEIGCIAQELHKDDIESAIIKDCATESTSAASSYAEGYKEGYQRALELVKWKIDNELKSRYEIQKTHPTQALALERLSYILWI